MTDQRPDQGGTASPGPDHLTATPTVPGQAEADDSTGPAAAAGTYEASEEDRRRGQAVKPGN